MTLQPTQFADELDGAAANPKDRRLAVLLASREFRHLAQGYRASRLTSALKRNAFSVRGRNQCR